MMECKICTDKKCKYNYHHKNMNLTKWTKGFKYCPYCSKELKRTDDEKLLNKIFNEPI